MLYTAYSDLLEHPAQAVQLRILASEDCGFVADGAVEGTVEGLVMVPGVPDVPVSDAGVQAAKQNNRAIAVKKRMVFCTIIVRCAPWKNRYRLRTVSSKIA